MKLGQIGRPLSSIKELCRQYVVNDKLIERLCKIAKDNKTATRDQIRAIEVLLDRGFGKPEQEIGITSHDSADRPTTEALIQTMSALRAELDSLAKGVELAAGK